MFTLLGAKDRPCLESPEYTMISILQIVCLKQQILISFSLWDFFVTFNFSFCNSRSTAFSLKLYVSSFSVKLVRQWKIQCRLTSFYGALQRMCFFVGTLLKTVFQHLLTWCVCHILMKYFKSFHWCICYTYLWSVTFVTIARRFRLA